MEPVEAYERLLAPRIQAAREEYAREMKIYHARFARFAKGDAGKYEEPTRPQMPKFQNRLTTDGTYEGIIKRHQGTQGLTYYADELDGWLGSFTRYTGSQRAAWLEIFDKNLVKSMRAGDDYETYVSQPCVSVVGGIQPRIISKLATGLDDGLVYRMLFIVPDRDEMPMVENRGWLDKQSDYAMYSNMLRTFMRQHEEMHEGTIDITATAAASHQLMDWINQGVTRYGRKNNASYDEDMQAMFSKMCVYGHKIAGLCSVMRAMTDARDGEHAKRMLSQGWQITGADVDCMIGLVDGLFIPSAVKAIDMIRAGDLNDQRGMVSQQVMDVLNALPRGVPIKVYRREFIDMIKSSVPGYKALSSKAISNRVMRIITSNRSLFIQDQDSGNYIYPTAHEK